VHNIKDTKQLKIILVLMTLTMLFMDRNFYHNFSGKDTSSYSDDIRVGSTFSYLGPNETAVFYAQNTIIILCLFLGDPNVRHKVFFGITTAFNYYCLIFLFSRGGYLASLVSWMFLGFMKDRRVLVVLVLFLVFWRSLVPTVVQQRIDMSSGDEDPLGYTEETVITDHSLTSRFEMWEQAVDLIGQHPIQGYGYGTTRFVNITTDNTRQRDSLHNGYLELLLELGGIGMIIFLALYTMGIRYGWLLYRNAKDPFLKAFGLGFVGCVLAILSGNIAGSYLFYFNVSGFFWVNLALVVRGLELANQTKETESESQDEKKFSARSRKKQLKPKRTLKPRMPAVRVPSH
jgi:O-antigen ligase